MKKSLLTTLMSVFLVLSQALTAVNASEELEVIQFEGKVVQVVNGEEMHDSLRGLCLTTVQADYGPVLIVEDVYMCYWGRKLKRKIGNIVSVLEESKFVIQDDQLTELLVQIYPDSQVYLFEYE